MGCLRAGRSAGIGRGVGPSGPDCSVAAGAAGRLVQTAAVMLTIFVLACGSEARAGATGKTGRWTLSLDLHGNHIEGMPLAWSNTAVRLLGRDGRLWEFSPREARNFRKSSSSFSGYSTAVFRNELLRELGKGFEITSTGHYLVAHPAGQRDRWGSRFEELYRSFVHYFSVRGFRCREPEFPLVAIVFPTQQQFAAYAQRDGYPVSRAILGYYSPRTNRVALFDTSGNRTTGDAWQQNADTIIHEATHQTAFNTGIHTRFAAQPRWVVEGLGTLFEARGVWDSRRYRRQSDRINQQRLERFRYYVRQKKLDGALATMISSDRQFSISPDLAYALAWAFTHWLVETRPRRYSSYLQKVAARPAFQSYSAEERLADFTSVLGRDFRMIESQFYRHMEKVR